MSEDMCNSSPISGAASVESIAATLAELEVDTWQRSDRDAMMSMVYLRMQGRRYDNVPNQSYRVVEGFQCVFGDNHA